METPSINNANTRQENDFFRTLIFLPIKHTRYLTDHKNGCQCEECIKKWSDADHYYGRIEAYESSLPEGDSILSINKNMTETSKIDV